MYDVLIIGAGPAGCTAAKILAERGLRVIVAEKFKLPRYKSCSGMIIKKSADLVRQYFGTDVPECAMCTPTENRGMIFTNDKGEEYRFEQRGINVWRSSFDSFLCSQAKEYGAEIHDGTAVVSCAEKDGYVSAVLNNGKNYVLNAKYVLDCEGVVGAVKRKIMKCRPSYITTYQAFNTGDIDLDCRYFYAYLQPALSEYDAWFNVKDNMLVLGVSVKDKSKTDFYYGRFIDYMMKNHGLKIEKQLRSEKWLMPHIDSDFNIDYGVGRVLFAGEAAGFLNPMGEGISAGLESGYCAANAVADYFGNLDMVYTEYKRRTQSLRHYMIRQWELVKTLTDFRMEKL